MLHNIYLSRLSMIRHDLERHLKLLSKHLENGASCPHSKMWRICKGNSPTPEDYLSIHWKTVWSPSFRIMPSCTERSLVMCYPQRLYISWPTLQDTGVWWYLCKQLLGSCWWTQTDAGLGFRDCRWVREAMLSWNQLHWLSGKSLLYLFGCLLWWQSHMIGTL